MKSPFTAPYPLARRGVVDRIWIVCLAVVAIGLFWPIARMILAGLFWAPDNSGELPEELVLARLADLCDWHADPLRGGFLTVTYRSPDPYDRDYSIERLDRPWRTRTDETPPSAVPHGPGIYDMLPISLSPDGRYLVMPAQELRDGGSIGRSSLLLEIWDRRQGTPWDVLTNVGQAGWISHDARYLAAAEYSERSATKIVSLETRQVVATVDLVPAGETMDSLAWHPTTNVLLIGGYGHVTLFCEPHFDERRLATALRDSSAWEADVPTRSGRSGYYCNENVSQLTFSPDGKLLICAMDLGVRVYAWSDVLQSADKLPAPRYSVESEAVPSLSGAKMKCTNNAIYDPDRQLILWSGYEGKLSCLDIETQEQSTLLKLPNRWCIIRMHLSPDGTALGCQLHRFAGLESEPVGFVVLDYPRVLERRHVQAAVKQRTRYGSR